MTRTTKDQQRVVQAVRDFFGSYQMPGKNWNERRKTNNGNKRKAIKKAEIDVEK
jgi:hypothetical protein